jgi:cytochrome c
MKFFRLIAASAALSISCSVLAAEATDTTNDAAALFKKSNCTTCHAVDKKVIGPALKDIAAKYKDDKEAPTKLAEKVRKGGSGSFGSMAMPAASKSVSDESINTLVAWVLEQK